ncbi:uncharacterized protein LOC142589699 isoform X1 [Dermacentor variabilis]|uniref:uncharacterized protein LOC142589699 isoform X1 n=1 Tax=Dermacentor variabilis TaxID=34621 RepID=UPI003F5BCC45
MLLAPSEIHYLHDDSAAGACVLPPDVVDELGQRLEENRDRVPRIQVVEKDGSWFALNDSYLRVYRELEKQGRCPRVNVTVVSLNKVPQDLQKGMTVTSSTATAVATATSAVVVGASAEQARCCANQEHHQQTGAAVNAEAPTTAPGATSGPPKATTANGRRRAETQGPRDASCDASAPQRRCFLKCRSSGCGAGSAGARNQAPGRPARPTVECADSSSDDDEEDDDDDDEEYDDDEYEDEDECLTCSVCERSFASGRRLSQHQQRKHHFGCPVCEALFPSLLALEHHRESLEHWSDDEERQPSRPKAPAKRQHRGGRTCDVDLDDDDDLDDEEDDEDEESSEEDTDSDGLEPGPKSQELERLL